jgi:hypothetical protein
MSDPLMLAAAAAGLRSGHPAGIALIVVGSVIIVLGLLRLFRLLPGGNRNPAVVGIVMIVAGLGLLVAGILLSIVR